MQALQQAEVTEALERVFARSEFATRETPALLRLLGDLWRAFWVWFFDLLSRVPVPRGMLPWLPWIVVTLMAALALWSILHLVRGARRAAREPRQSVAPDVSQPEDAAAWESAFRRALTERRYREAAHALFHAAVLRLHESGAVRYDSGKTPGQYRREVSGEKRAAFDRFVLQFLPLAFGAREPDAAAVEALLRTGTELGVRA